MNNTIKTIALLAIAIALMLNPAPALAQGTALSTTTLSSAIASAGTTTINLSTTGMLSNGPANQVNTGLYIDREFMWVITVVDTTHAIVARGKGGTRPIAHPSGATVWFNAANTTYPAIANSQFLSPGGNNAQEPIGGVCTASNQPTLPIIYTVTGHKLDCLNSVWVLVSSAEYPYYGGSVASVAGTQAVLGHSMTITGTNAIVTLTVPNGWAIGQCVSIYPTAAFTTTTAGNISLATTAVAHKTLLECWDGSKWNPSY